MYVIMQIWIYLIIAMLLGAVLAWAFKFCECNKAELQSELDAAKAERDELAERLAGRPTGSNARDDARVAALEAELEEANKKLALAGAGGGALGLAAASSNNDEVDTIRARNSFLEARVKFLEDGFKKPNSDAPVDNTNFVVSEAGSMNSQELEAAIIAAGDGVQPKSVEAGADADDLLLIDGVGPKNNEWLKKNGIYYFWQIATMNVSELAWLANNLPNFGSRVYRENWVSQCANLAKGLPPR